MSNLKTGRILTATREADGSVGRTEERVLGDAVTHRIKVGNLGRQYLLVGPPCLVLIEDEQMEADQIALAGYFVEGDRGSLIVGTVVAARFGEDIVREPSHDHVYVQNLPGRRVVDVSVLQADEYELDDGF